ncbi:MAG: SGNH/GDSL hydrolase family protein, partial [Kiritimatiellaeota bacterium]|nr:SGNH/GDSL hydrolase family protein [Kiritimatiellota bacterium]
MIFGLLVLAAGLTVIVDPFLHYRAPRFFKPQFSAKNALQMIPGVLRHIPHDSVLIGDSMLINT